MRAAVIGSPGDANGSLSTMTQLSASPTTSTPCQKLDVANRTACGVAAELVQQLRARRRALRENRIVERHLRHRLHRAHRRVAGEEDEGAAARALQDLDHLAARGDGEVRRPRIGHLRRQIQNRLLPEVELRRQPDLVGLLDAEPRADVVEAAVDGQRRRRQHRRRACDRAAARGRSSRRRSARRAGTCRARGTRRSRRTPSSPPRSRKRRSSRSWPARRASVAASSAAGRGRVVRRRRSRAASRSSASVASRMSSAPVRLTAESQRLAERLGVARTRSSFLPRPLAAVRERELGEERLRAVAQALDGLRDLLSGVADPRRAGRGHPLDVARELLDAVGADVERRSTAWRRPRAGAPRRGSRGVHAGITSPNAFCRTAASAHSR